MDANAIGLLARDLSKLMAVTGCKKSRENFKEIEAQASRGWGRPSKAHLAGALFECVEEALAEYAEGLRDH